MVGFFAPTDSIFDFKFFFDEHWNKHRLWYSVDIYPFRKSKKYRSHKIIHWNERKKKNKQTNDTRKIWQQFDYFGAGFYLSLQLYIIVICLLVCTCVLHVSIEHFIRSILRVLCIDPKKAMSFLSIYRFARSKRFKCGQVHWFLFLFVYLFIYINIFLRSVLYDDALSWFWLLTHIFGTEKKRISYAMCFECTDNLRFG